MMGKNRFQVICCGTVLTLAVTMSAAPALAFDAAGAAQSASDFMSALDIWLSEGYRAAPALMLGLAAFAAIPLLATGARMNARIVRDRAATRRYRAARHGDASDKISSEVRDHPAFACLEVVGASRQRFAIERDMLRIGREDDNDIRIPSSAIHRYHAAIYREAFDDWHIADLSGTGGNGIAVNGQRCSGARLQDGDVIDLGPGKLRFRAMAA